MTQRLSFDIYSCVRVYYRYADCNTCVQVCPADAVQIENDKVFLNLERCLECGACVGNCPTESFRIKGFDPIELVRRLSTSDTEIVSCKLNLPCASAIDSQHMASIVISKGSDLRIDTGHCKSCQIGRQLDIIKKNAEEANYILQSVGSSFRVKLEDIYFEPKQTETSRRSILKLFAKKTAALAFWAIEERLNLPQDEKQEENREFKNIVSEKVVPRKRIALLEALSGADIPQDASFEVDMVSFTSDKWIDSSVCTNCGICGNICPTGAITNSDDRLKNLFNPSICIKCRICHDTCPEKCLHLEQKLKLHDFINNRYKVLASHVMIACSECLVPFSYKGDSTVCPRCRQLEDEIRELLKVGD